MKIQQKFLLLLISVALPPLIVLFFFHHQTMNQLGETIGTKTQEMLIQDEREFLQKTVDDYSRILKKDKEILETALRVQAREIERRLARPPSADQDQVAKFPEAFTGKKQAGMTLTGKHMRQTRPRGHPPVWVDYDHQVWFTPRGVDREALKEELDSLATLGKTYRFVYRLHPDHIYWQQTSLESGLLSFYPAHSSFPEGYDPRQEAWYRQAKRNQSLTWVMTEDPVTKVLTEVAALPVSTPDGAFAGVTSITLVNTGLYSLKIPKTWAQHVQVMLVRYGTQSDRPGERFQIFTHQASNLPGSLMTSQSERASTYKPAANEKALQKILADLLAEESGVQQIHHQGQNLLIAFGSHGPNETFPVIILPYEPIIAQATKIKTLVGDQTAKYLTLTGGVFVGATLFSILLALYSSRSVTHPVRQLQNATNALAGGSFETRVSISSGDELQELGDIVNDMGPMLLENQRMRQALTVAEKAQQYLLPERSPRFEGYDISGLSVYSDETGGDYYDFMDIPEDTNSLGIVIGDVSGHGIGAALLMASARGALRAYVSLQPGSLVKTLTMLNTHLIKDTREGQFLTLFYGLLEVGQNRLGWVSAGHEPALWFRKRTGTIVELPNTGMPLGIMPEAAFEEGGPISLENGDLVLIATDGIRETRNPKGEIFGLGRLQQLLIEHSHLTTRELCRKIVAVLKDYRQGTVQEDDVTMVIIKVRAEEYSG
ncbi:MAG: SpoIIE family protein phosphatase [Desulfohalobiaceae bacterium]|nr:SpoIIE family protein phosphatase [Desulfohalobiaceae bacterium]